MVPAANTRPPPGKIPGRKQERRKQNDYCGYGPGIMYIYEKHDSPAPAAITAAPAPWQLIRPPAPAHSSLFHTAATPGSYTTAPPPAAIRNNMKKVSGIFPGPWTTARPHPGGLFFSPGQVPGSDAQAAPPPVPRSPPVGGILGVPFLSRIHHRLSLN